MISFFQRAAGKTTGIPWPVLKARLLCLLNVGLEPDAAMIRKFRGIHRGKRAFLIGNGPSLAMSDLDRLQNEITFACNKIHLAFPSTSWRPTYHFIQSDIVLEESFPLLQSFPHQLFLSHQVLQFGPRIPGAVCFQRDHFTDPLKPRFQKRPLGHVYRGFTVLYTCLQFAYYMGIREVYLIGVDFNYTFTSEPTAEPGATPVYINQGEQNYFTADYKTAGQKCGYPHLEYNIPAYEKAREVFAADGGVIRNATRGGKLGVFERADFDSLF